MSFIDVSDNEYERTESEGETDELYTPITPTDSSNIFFSDLHSTNLNNFLVLPSFIQDVNITSQIEYQYENENEYEYESGSETEQEPQQEPQQEPEQEPQQEPQSQTEVEEINTVSPDLSSSIPSPPLLSLNEPVQLNDIFSLPQLIQNLQLFSNNTNEQPNRFIRQRPRDSNVFQLNHNDILENVLQTSIHDIGGYKKVISDEGKKEINFLKYESSKFEEKKCTITQEEFEEKQIIAQLPCNHIFNKEGILYWLENESNACPICRRELKHKEIKIEYNPESEELSHNHNQQQNLNPIENINSRFHNIITAINTRN